MWTEERLNEMLTTPSDALVEDIKKINGDIMILGAGGKMGPSMALLIRNAIIKAGIQKKVIAVSRFSDPVAKKLLSDNQIEMISIDLLDVPSLYALPEVENVIFMAGKKFGTTGEEWKTWGMNSTLPAFVADKFKKSNIGVFSTGNVYPIATISSGGCLETDPAEPIGEYPMSCLARERAFEYAANTYGTKVFIYRLSFAVDLRYGVLYDIANAVQNSKPINLGNSMFNCVWQGWANEIAVRGLLHATAPMNIMNVTGPEMYSTKKVAEKFGEYFGVTPVFEGVEENSAYVMDPSKAFETFGYPSVCANTLIRWQAEWIKDGGRALNKPTHFEERSGKY